MIEFKMTFLVTGLRVCLGGEKIESKEREVNTEIITLTFSLIKDFNLS